MSCCMVELIRKDNDTQWDEAKKRFLNDVQKKAGGIGLLDYACMIEYGVHGIGSITKKNTTRDA